MGTCLARPLFMQADKTTTESTLEFFKRLYSSLERTRPLPYLVYDRHAAHKASVVQEYLQGKFRPLMMPKQTCQFNPQEKIWLAVK